MGPPRRRRTVTDRCGDYEPAAAESQQRHSQPSPQRQGSPLQQAQPATQSHVQFSHNPQALPEQQAPAAFATDAVVVDDFARTASGSTVHFPSAAQQAGFATEVAAVAADFADRSQHLQLHASPQRQGSPSQQRQPSAQAHVQVSHNPQALPVQQPWVAAAFAPVPETVITSPNPESAVRVTKVRSLVNIMGIPSPETRKKRESQAQNSTGERGWAAKETQRPSDPACSAARAKTHFCQRQLSTISVGGGEWPASDTEARLAWRMAGRAGTSIRATTSSGASLLTTRSDPAVAGTEPWRSWHLGHSWQGSDVGPAGGSQQSGRCGG